jgi:antitoxin (DNA-binding transcriptional repressor) of toxin-antitoxin stability system
VVTVTEVSVRELKSHLAEYIRRAESGEEIAVTRRGRRVIVLKQGSGNSTQDRKKTLDEKLLDLQARGIIAWNGKKFVPPKKGVPLRGDGPTVSEMIIEDRGPR